MNNSNKSPIYKVYLPHKADVRAKEQKHQSGKRKRLKDTMIEKYVIQKLKLGWSPEQIAGRLPLDCPSITYDNGSENIEHQKINEALGTQSYFCNPYHSWKKGSVEYPIGLIRRFLPKKTDFAIIKPSQLKTIENLLNNRPRKCLNFKTPPEVFSSCVALAG
ncbi:MAG: IS30 family transposase [Thermodesulfobacteriota bacterium]|jgi:IS30 family transposase|nr:MAG: IS30 family transposase [Thermodesulfobacteriota bacterium]